MARGFRRRGAFSIGYTILESRRRRVFHQEAETTMADENEIYREGSRVLRRLRALCRQLADVDASDQQAKQRALDGFEASRDQLAAALEGLSRLV